MRTHRGDEFDSCFSFFLFGLLILIGSIPAFLEVLLSVSMHGDKRCGGPGVAVLSAAGERGQPVFAVQRGDGFIKIGPRRNICWGHGIKEKRNFLLPS